MKKIISLCILFFLIYLSSSTINLIINNSLHSSFSSNSKKSALCYNSSTTCSSIKNDGIAAKVMIPNTLINYSVAKTSDNEYYLDHDLKHKESKSGAIFMDYRNSGNGSDKNTILYGHNMKDGTMFKGLMAYKEKNFFSKNKYIYLYLNKINKLTKWEVFSAYVTDTDFNFIKTEFHSDIDFTKFLNILKGKSTFSSKVKLNKTDHILTLSTCSYEFDNARFVVHAKLLNN